MKTRVERIYTIVAYNCDGLCNLFPFYVDNPCEMKRFMVQLRNINRDKGYISVSVEKKCVTTYRYR